MDKVYTLVIATGALVFVSSLFMKKERLFISPVAAENSSPTRSTNQAPLPSMLSQVDISWKNDIEATLRSLALSPMANIVKARSRCGGEFSESKEIHL
jgi:hypothetical protein